MDSGTKQGVTYYSDLQSMQSISTPIVDNDVQMGFKGHFDVAWDKYTLNFDSFGYGLRKNRHNQGAIFCSDASKLFSLYRGYVGMILSFPESFSSGVYYPLVNAEGVKENLLWGVNVGQFRSSMPCVYASLTDSGIELTIWTSYCKYTVINKYSTLPPNQDIFMEFMWDGDGIEEYIYSDGYKATMCIRINGEDIVLGNPPIDNNSIENLNFYALETPHVFSNLDCTIRRLVIGNDIPHDIEEEWYSSSSSSSSLSSESSLSSLSSNSSSSSSSSNLSSDSSSSSNLSSDSSLSSNFVSFSYTIMATLDWEVPPYADLDLYVKRDGYDTCYFQLDSRSKGGLTLNDDAHPSCQSLPLTPEITTGAFTASEIFYVWYNQYSNCVVEQAPTITTFAVENTGEGTITVNGTPVTSGNSFTISSFAYGGYNTGDINNYENGTSVTVICEE